MRLLAFGLAAMLVLAAGLAIDAARTPIEVAPRFVVEGADPSQGERALVKYGCGGCHRVAGVRGAEGVAGPPLTGLGLRTYIAGNLSNTPENLVTWIMDPQSIEPGTAMPNLGVTEEDARAIAAYLYAVR